VTPRSSRTPSPRNLFDVTTSRVPTPNVFDPLTNSTHATNTNSTNSGLGNIPVLPPNHNFAQNPIAPGSILDPALGGVAPSRSDVNMLSPGNDGGSPEDTTMTSPARPTRSREEERAAHNTQLLAQLRQERQEREHEKRKAEAARQHEAMLRNQRDDDLGDFEPDESGDADMDISPTNKSPTDTNMDAEPTSASTSTATNTNPTGTSPTDTNMSNVPPADASATSVSNLASSPFQGLTVGSPAELEFLRTLPFNEDNAFDDLYRGNNYMPAANMDDATGEPNWDDPEDEFS
jgi:hypothetical protein